MILEGALRRMLQGKGLDDEAAEWIIKDVEPRLTFLDGAFTSDSLDAPPGISAVFAMAIRKALDEIIELEIELYREKSGAKGTTE